MPFVVLLGIDASRGGVGAPAVDDTARVPLFALELDRRLAAAHSRVRSVLAHPGIATTNLAAHVGGFPGLMNRAMKFMVNDAEHGALPTLYAASQDIPGGSYVGPDGIGSIRGYPAIGKPSRAAADPAAASALWQVTARVTGIDTVLPEAAPTR